MQLFDVVADVERGVVDPGRERNVERDAHQPLAVAWHEADTPLDVLDEAREVDGAVVDARRADVHRHGRTLEIGEGGVSEAKPPWQSRGVNHGRILERSGGQATMVGSGRPRARRPHCLAARGADPYSVNMDTTMCAEL